MTVRRINAGKSFKGDSNEREFGNELTEVERNERGHSINKMPKTHMFMIIIILTFLGHIGRESYNEYCR